MLNASNWENTHDLLKSLSAKLLLLGKLRELQVPLGLMSPEPGMARWQKQINLHARAHYCFSTFVFHRHLPGYLCSEALFPTFPPPILIPDTPPICRSQEDQEWL